MRLKILFLLVLLTSCVGQKKVLKSNHDKETVEKIIVKKDSAKLIDRSLAINDRFLLSLKTNNKSIDSVIRTRLKDFSASKKSGKNFYTAKFDYDKLALSIIAKMDETKTIQTEKNTEKDIKKDTKQTDSDYFYNKIKVVPWWLWALVAFWLLPQIVDRLRMFLTPISYISKKIKS